MIKFYIIIVYKKMVCGKNTFYIFTIVILTILVVIFLVVIGTLYKFITTLYKQNFPDDGNYYKDNNNIFENYKRDPEIIKEFSIENVKISAANIFEVTKLKKNVIVGKNAIVGKNTYLKNKEGKIVGMCIEKEKHIEFYFQCMVYSPQMFYKLSKSNIGYLTSKDKKENLALHKGVSELFLDISLEIYKIIDNNATDKPIFIAGRSLGGVYGILTAKYALEKNNKVLVYTLGTPKFCNDKFKEYIESYDGKNLLGMYRIFNTSDAIPALSPTSIPSYLSVEKLYYDYRFLGKPVCYESDVNDIGSAHNDKCYFDITKENIITVL